MGEHNETTRSTVSDKELGRHVREVSEHTLAASQEVSAPPQQNLLPTQPESMRAAYTPADDVLDNSSLDEKQPTHTVAAPAMDFPDGGLRAWNVAVGTGLVLFCTMGMINTWGVFQAYYQNHQLRDQSESAISWIGSLQTFFLFASALVGGPLFDRYGEKVLWPAGLIYVISYMLTSLCSKYWHFMLAQGLLSGMANGMTMAPAISVVPQYFRAKRGAAMGITVAGSSLGGVVLPIALSRMLESSIGFGWTVRIIGFMFLGLLGASFSVIRARLPPRQSNFFMPSAFRNLKYSTHLTAGFFMFMGIFIPIFYLPVYAQGYGMSSQLASYLLSILNAASFLGRTIPGILADKLGIFNTLAASGISTGILIFCWPSTHSNAAIIVFAAIFGFCSGGVVSGVSLGMSSCAKSPRDFGTYIGMGMGVFSIGALISPPINGAIVADYHGFTQAAYFSGALTLFGGFLSIATKFTDPNGFKLKS